MAVKNNELPFITLRLALISLQMSVVVLQVLIDKTGNEKIRMVIAGLHAQG